MKWSCHKIGLVGLSRLMGVLGILSGLVLMLSLARRESDKAGHFQAQMQAIKVVAPNSPPPLTQESIDLALVMYGIDIPSSARHPTLDMDLSDRGLTSRAAFSKQASVTVGPAAFSSWGLLGSTLAHELEVHCQQNFLMIYVMDLVGMNGTTEAERQAYVHELRNAKRFGLTIEDADLIADTMEYYYPDSQEPALAWTTSVRTWLARHLLTD